ncbi:PE-PPE domain-containing protein [Mycolicibacterium sp. GF69]|nr:PE-PPE domain-containing protein [Mycolicibacterium sp. GF69]
MKAALRSLGAMCLAVLAAIAVAVAWTTATAVQLAASALIMGGTEHPLSTPPDDPLYISSYLDNAVNFFINPAAGAPTGTGDPRIGEVDRNVDRNVYAVVYPAAFFPVFGSKTFDSSVRDGVLSLNGCVRGAASCNYNHDASYNVDPAADPDVPPAADEDYVVFGYSQSAVVASLVKRALIADPRVPTAPGEPTPETSFFLLANPMRPNGGILARGPEGLTIPIIGITFHGATPTNTCGETGPCMPTVDVAAQYDGLGGDAPASLTNVLAMINAVAGYYYLHGDLQNADFDDAQYQGSYGDTDYYLYPTKRLPILTPFAGVVPSPILTLLDAPLRVLIEGAYERDVSPGVATKVGLLPFRNPIKTAINLVRSIPVGIDDAIEEISGARPLGTQPTTSPFGVGGPDLPAAPTDDDGAQMSMMWSSARADGQNDETVIAGDEPAAASPKDSLEHRASEAKPVVLVEKTPLEGEGETQPAAQDGQERGQEVVDEASVDQEGVGKEGVEQEGVGQAGGANAESSLTSTPAPAAAKPGLPKLPKLPKLRGPIKFDSPIRMGSRPAAGSNVKGAPGAEKVSEPGDPTAHTTADATTDAPGAAGAAGGAQGDAAA